MGENSYTEEEGIKKHFHLIMSDGCVQKAISKILYSRSEEDVSKICFYYFLIYDLYHMVAVFETLEKDNKETTSKYSIEILKLLQTSLIERIQEAEKKHKELFHSDLSIEDIIATLKL